TFQADGQVFHPLDTTVINLDGAWQMRVTHALPPAADDAAAYTDAGITAEARALVRESVSGGAWTAVTLPAMVPFFRDHDGEAVFRRKVEVPRSESGKDMVLSLGALDDFDDTFFNGVQVGHTDSKTQNWWQQRRVYTVPGRLVKPGRNVIAVRLFDRFNDGGFAGNGGLPMSLTPKQAGRSAESYYHADYRTDFPFGDDPYRYYRW
ncbi:MAG TPA: hypothetical protein VKT77_17935, partial [Chthonomonadaceae bacterium]|nr:hypothetical protein [Chthonomonadaceae bacterium]